MMKILLPLFLISATCLAESTSEEALILNQELEFLETSAREMEVNRPQVAKDEDEDTKSPEELSLERTYFSDSERDEIRTRAAAPKRLRSF